MVAYFHNSLHRGVASPSSLPLIAALLASACGFESDEVPSNGGTAGSGPSGDAGSQAGGSSGAGGGSSSNQGGTTSGNGGTSGGSSTAGSGAAGGDEVELEGRGSPGCGASEPLTSGRYTIDVDGSEREYVLDVPGGYDTYRPYRLIFTLHWVSVGADAVVTGEPGEYGGLGPYYGLQALADDSAIFVSPQGLDNGWYNENDVEVDFVRALIEHFNDNLCIDQDRIFSTGFSYGGMMSIALGCEMGDVFRAIAPMSGSRTSGCNLDKTDRVAFWGAHGASDVDVTPAEGRSARDVFVQRDHCDQETTAVDPSPCASYDGCDAGYPVTWCEFDDDHYQWSEAPAAMWQFFSQF
jgi:polyhydroxybutyrate depolymerase